MKKDILGAMYFIVAATLFWLSSACTGLPNALPGMRLVRRPFVSMFPFSEKGRQFSSDTSVRHMSFYYFK